jgi:hypothetical protein
MMGKVQGTSAHYCDEQVLRRVDMRFGVLEELHDSGLDKRQTGQVPSIDWIKLDGVSEAILCQRRFLVVDDHSFSLQVLRRIHAFTLDLLPQRTTFVKVLVDAKVGTDATATKLHDIFELE